MTEVKNIKKLIACKDLEIDMLGDFSSMSSIITWRIDQVENGKSATVSFSWHV